MSGNLLFETKYETISEYEDSIIMAHYIRQKGSKEWQWTGTLEYTPDGADLIDSPGMRAAK